MQRSILITCPSVAAPHGNLTQATTMEFYTLQLRSADEGGSVIIMMIRRRENTVFPGDSPSFPHLTSRAPCPQVKPFSSSASSADTSSASIHSAASFSNRALTELFRRRPPPTPTAGAAPRCFRCSSLKQNSSLNRGQGLELFLNARLHGLYYCSG